jgi:nucleotide-binding universal stress UspA family protein
MVLLGRVLQRRARDETTGPTDRGTFASTWSSIRVRHLEVAAPVFLGHGRRAVEEWRKRCSTRSSWQWTARSTRSGQRLPQPTSRRSPQVRSTCCTFTKQAWSSPWTNTEAQDVVDRAVKQLEADRVEVSGDAVSARSGSIAPTIIETAHALECDLIVMGTRGLSDFSGLMVGSIAHKVIHHADGPVLVVR